MVIRQTKISSKEKLQRAFLEIYSAKPLGNITVKEIAKKAGLNRSTFYLYYNDIYSMLEDIENEIIRNILPNIDIFLASIDNHQDILMLNENINSYKRFFPYAKILLGMNANPSFTRKIKAAVKTKVVKIIEMKNQAIINEYIMEYIVSAHLGVITYWLQRGCDLEVGELAGLIRAIFLNGPYQLLINSKGVIIQEEGLCTPSSILPSDH